MASSVESQDVSITSSPARNTITKLQARLDQKEQDLQLAATFGKQLLEANNELNQQLEATGTQMAAKLEALEQEKYALVLKLEQRSRMEANYTEEIENLKANMKRQKLEQETSANIEHQAKLMELQKQLSNARNDLEAAILSEKQMEAKCQDLEETVHDLKDQLKVKANSTLNETTNSDVAALAAEIEILQSEKISMQKEVSECRAMSRLELESMQRQMAARQEDVEDAQRQSTAYYNTLEKCREEVQELKVELDLLKMESQSQKEKGNSLFSEVEDRRLEAEKELISAKVQSERALKQLELTKQQHQKLKVQLSSLLHLTAGQHADARHKEFLEDQLNRALGDIQHLTAQLHKFKQNKNLQLEFLSKKDRKPSEVYDDSYLEYLKACIEQKDKEIETVNNDVKTKDLMLMSQNDRIRDLERKLYQNEHALEARTAEYMKVKIRIDELRIKYEPEKVQKKPQKTVRLEKIPLTSQNGTDVGKKDSLEHIDKENETVLKENKSQMHSVNGNDVNEKQKIAPQVLKDNTDENIPKDPLDILSGDKFATKERKPSFNSISLSKNTKKVSMSDDVDVIEIPDYEYSPTETVSGEKFPEKEGSALQSKVKSQGRARGRQRYQGSKKVTEAPDECKSQ